MQQPTAQMAALAIHGNALLQHRRTEPFFPNNSACANCESITFVHLEPKDENWEEVPVADTPDDWLDLLPSESVRGIRIHWHSADDPKIPDRMAAAFAGGGGTWLLETIRDGISDFWEAKWAYQEEDRAWKVSYGRVAWDQPTVPHEPAILNLLVQRLEKVLPKIAAFAREQHLENFAEIFDAAVESLHSETPLANTACEDIAPANFLSLPGQRLMAAAHSGWVFGGMGSWNDIVFQGEELETYDALSQDLFELLCQAIVEATNSTIEKNRN